MKKLVTLIFFCLLVLANSSAQTTGNFKPVNLLCAAGPMSRMDMHIAISKAHIKDSDFRAMVASNYLKLAADASAKVLPFEADTVDRIHSQFAYIVDALECAQQSLYPDAGLPRNKVSHKELARQTAISSIIAVQLVGAKSLLGELHQPSMIAIRVSDYAETTGPILFNAQARLERNISWNKQLHEMSDWCYNHELARMDSVINNIGWYDSTRKDIERLTPKDQQEDDIPAYSFDPPEQS